MEPSGAWWLGRPAAGLRYIVHCRAYAVGMGVHLTLPDALQWSWLVPDLLCAAGAALLALRGAVLGWALCAVGLAWPLIALEDQLTQSALLLACAVAATVAAFGPAASRAERLEGALPLAVRLLTVGTYGLAALHKMNRDFLDPSVSCAVGGMTILAENWSLPALASPALHPYLPPLFLCVEISLAVLLVVRPGLGIVLGLLMHLPLTLIFAPAFAFAMMPGWVCFFREDELRHLGALLGRRWRTFTVLGLVPCAASIALYYQDHWVTYPWWFLKEAALWIALVWALASRIRRPPGLLGWWSAWREPVRAGRALPVVVAVLWLGNGLTPYTGLQFHHAGAMLSNLRIDRGCWNSLVFPESMRIVDPYVRVTQARVGGRVPGARELEAHIVERLWSEASLSRARARWCAAGAGPLWLTGTHDAEAFTLEDACARWPFDVPRTGFRGYQQNLAPDCPQSCIH